MTPQTVNAVNLPLQNALNFPGRHSAATVLRSAGSGRIQLRRHRLDHRSRNQPYLRLRRQHLRLEGPRAQLVDSRRSGAFPGRHSKTRSSV